MTYDEIVERLRVRASMIKFAEPENDVAKVMDAAADAIEELQEERNVWKATAEDWRDAYHHWFENYQKDVPKWIPVTERLPKDDERVLTIGPKGGMQICRFRDRTPTLNWHFWTAGNKRIATVTHWQPLPEPPKEETE